MKKCIILSIVILSTLIYKPQITTADVYNPGFGTAQPCNQYWWPNLEWEGPGYEVVEIDGCVYLCVYYTRKTPPGRVEFQITEFVRLPSSNCNTNHDFDLIKRMCYLEMFQQLIVDYPEGDSVIPMAIQESICRRMVPHTPDTTLDDLNPFSVDSLLINLNANALSTEDSVTIAPLVDPPVNGLYTINIDQLWTYCNDDTVCCRAYYFVYYDANKILTRVAYDSLLEASYLGPDTCTGQYCEYNCNSLIWNWSIDTVGGFYKSSQELEYGNDTELNIYPIPVKNNLVVELTNSIVGILTISVYDLNGVRIINEHHNKNEKLFRHTINMSNIVKGNYFLEIKIGNRKYNKKIQIK